MKKPLFSLLFVLTSFVYAPFLSLGQDTHIDFNYAWVGTPALLSKVSNGNEELQITFYPDSIPSARWFEAGKGPAASYYVGSDPVLYDFVVMNYPYTNNFPVSEYRVLSVYNPSTSLKKIYTYREYYKTSSGKIYYSVGKIACVLQAKDETGNWKDLEQMRQTSGKDKIYIESGDFIEVEKKDPKMFLYSHEVLNVIVKPPSGDFDAELRLKFLVNTPPDYPEDQFIYSNTFKGSIKK